MQKQIIIEVRPDGSIKIEALGFTGQSCEKATKLIEQALGTRSAGARKGEYYREEKIVGRVSQ